MRRVKRRSLPTKGARRALLVCTEGETERDYLEGLRKSLHIPADLLHVVNGRETSVANIAQFLRKAHAGKVWGIPDISFDQLWGVAGTEWKRDWRSVATRPVLEDALKAERRRTLWALSSSSFERWLLFHFEDNPPTLDARESAKRVGLHLDGYGIGSKRLTKKMLGDLLPLTDKALGRAEEWRAGREAEDNFTDADMLVRAVLNSVG